MSLKATIFLHHTLRSRFVVWRKQNLLASWVLLVLPLLLSMTVFAKSPLILTGILSLTSASLLWMRPAKETGGTPLLAHSPSTQTRFSSTQTLVPLPALTTYRAHMMLMTILAILAVDFPVFPRELAKCENFGASLVWYISAYFT